MHPLKLKNQEEISWLNILPQDRNASSVIPQRNFNKMKVELVEKEKKKKGNVILSQNGTHKDKCWKLHGRPNSKSRGHDERSGSSRSHADYLISQRIL